MIWCFKKEGHKLQNVYKGAYRVIKIHDNNNCTLLVGKDKDIKVHKNRLKLAT